MSMLVYDTPADSWDEYLGMSKNTCLKAMFRFATKVIKVFESEYLRGPNSIDITRLMALGELRGFPRYA